MTPATPGVKQPTTTIRCNSASSETVSSLSSQLFSYVQSHQYFHPLAFMMSAPAIPFLRSAATPVVRTRIAPRAFSTSTIHWNAGSAPLPARKPVGAFRGGLFGFLVGSVLAGASVYYYVLAEYRVSNEMLTDDIFALQSATQKLNRYITELETKVDELQKKSK